MIRDGIRLSLDLDLSNVLVGRRRSRPHSHTRSRSSHSFGQAVGSLLDVGQKTAEALFAPDINRHDPDRALKSLFTASHKAANAILAPKPIQPHRNNADHEQKHGLLDDTVARGLESSRNVHLDVITINLDQSALSDEDRSATPTPINEPAPIRKRAVLIGIQYQHKLWPRHPEYECDDPSNCPKYHGPEDVSMMIDGAHHDAIQMLRFLKDRGFLHSDIRILVDDPDEECLAVIGDIEHQPPTRENLMSSFKWLVDGAKANDQLFLHYSGHGEQVKDYDEDEEDGRDETIIPIDWEGDEAGQIVDDQMWEILVSHLDPQCRFIAVFDCCNSGTLLDLQYCALDSARPLSICSSRMSVIEQEVEVVNSNQAGIQDNLRARVYRNSWLSGTMDLQNTYLATTVDRVRGLSSPSGSVSGEFYAIVKPTKARRKRTLNRVGNDRRKASAHVVCWSACRDGELSYGDRSGGAMIEAFIQCMDNCRTNFIKPTYTHILDDLRMRLQKYWMNHPAGGQEKQQFPQLSSSLPLNLDDIFEF